MIKKPGPQISAANQGVISTYFTSLVWGFPNSPPANFILPVTKHSKSSRFTHWLGGFPYE